jgi:hypothetical protein
LPPRSAAASSRPPGSASTILRSGELRQEPELDRRHPLL